jgi:hypothetical protein
MVQFLLGLSIEDLEPKVSYPRENAKRPTTQVSADRSSEPTVHPSTGMAKELALRNSTGKRRKKGERALGTRHAKVHQKVELGAQEDPDAQSDRRGPPTDRPQTNRLLGKERLRGARTRGRAPDT